MKTIKINLKSADDCPFREFISSGDYEDKYYCNLENSKESCNDKKFNLIPIGCPLITSKLEISADREAIKSSKIKELETKIEEEKNIILSDSNTVITEEKNISKLKKEIKNRKKELHKLHSNLLELKEKNNDTTRSET